jgi:ADP-Ribosyltransferase in polyvalent proteins
MATLAEVLRQAGYVTPQGQVVGPRTTTAQTMSNYIRNIIPNAAQNLAQQRSDIDAALTMGDQGIQVGDRAAFERALEQVPNLMGSVAKLPTAERMKIAQTNAALPVEQGGLGLPSNNTQWQRAEAMGFNVREPMYHGTQKEFTQFDLSKHGTSTDKGDFGKAVYVTTDPNIANVYAYNSMTQNAGSQVLPVLIKEGKQYKVVGQQGMNELIEKLGGEDKWYELTQNPEAYANAIKKLGYDTVRDRGYAQTAVYDPTSIRSKFAAFDPKRRKEADILAGSLAVPLADEDTRRSILEKLFEEKSK